MFATLPWRVTPSLARGRKPSERFILPWPPPGADGAAPSMVALAMTDVVVWRAILGGRQFLLVP